MIKKEDITLGSQVYFIDGDCKQHPCRVIAIDLGDAFNPILVSFGRDNEGVKDFVNWRLGEATVDCMKQETSVESDATYDNCGELVKWVRLYELEPQEKLIGDIELGAAALSMVEPHKSGDINKNIDIISPAKEGKINDAVNHPSHYCQDGIECIDVIKATTKGLNEFDAFCQGNAMKYLFRWQFKNGAEDLKKARWYIDKLIEVFEGKVNKSEI